MGGTDLAHELFVEPIEPGLPRGAVAGELVLSCRFDVREQIELDGLGYFEGAGQGAA